MSSTSLSWNKGVGRCRKLKKRRYFTENETYSVERFRRLGHVVMSVSGKSERLERSTFLRFGDLNKARMANARSSEIVLKSQWW